MRSARDKRGLQIKLFSVRSEQENRQSICIRVFSLVLRNSSAGIIPSKFLCVCVLLLASVKGRNFGKSVKHQRVKPRHGTRATFELKEDVSAENVWHFQCIATFFVENGSDDLMKVYIPLAADELSSDFCPC